MEDERQLRGAKYKIRDVADVAGQLQRFSKTLEIEVQEKADLLDKITEMRSEIAGQEKVLIGHKVNSDRLHNETLDLEKESKGLEEHNIKRANEVRQASRDYEKLYEKFGESQSETKVLNNEINLEHQTCKEIQKIIEQASNHLQEQTALHAAAQQEKDASAREAMMLREKIKDTQYITSAVSSVATNARRGRAVRNQQGNQYNLNSSGGRRGADGVYRVNKR